MKISYRPSAMITWFLSCAFLGAVLVSLLGPRSIAWYFEPPVEIGVSCKPAVEYSMAKLVKMQMVGMGIGVVLGAVLLFWFTKRDKDSDSSLG